MTAPAHRLLGYFWACSLALPVIREDEEALPVWQNVPTSQTSLGEHLVCENSPYYLKMIAAIWLIANSSPAPAG
jgi:hypothetical protein